MDNITINRVLIVDDSPFMCQYLKMILAAEGCQIETAQDGKEAIEKVAKFRPNVITLDIEMPIMSGLDALDVIMDKFPTPVIVVSSQTTRGAEISLQALERGAFDVVAKPNGEIPGENDTFKKELVTKIKVARLVPPEKLRRSKGDPIIPAVLKLHPVKDGPQQVVVIGTSTGGPSALQTILTQIPVDFPAPILVVQHMPSGFTKMMAERLNPLCGLIIKEAEDGTKVVPGTVLIAPGGMQMFLERSGSQVVTRVVKESTVATPYRPSVNVLFESAAEIYADHVVALVLTGMGSDGLEGCRRLKEKGAFVLAESEQSCIVYGMSRSIVEAGLADKVIPLPDMGRQLIQAVYDN